MSNGTSVTEIFGSRPKMRHFLEVEDRKFHRSEYRKARAAGIQSPYRGRSVRDAIAPSDEAFALDHAGRLLLAMAAATRRAPLGDGVGDPFPAVPGHWDPWSLAALRRRSIQRSEGEEIRSPQFRAIRTV